MSSTIVKNETREEKTKRLIEQATAEIDRFVKTAPFGVIRVELSTKDGNVEWLRVNPERSFK